MRAASHYGPDATRKALWQRMLVVLPRGDDAVPISGAEIERRTGLTVHHRDAAQDYARAVWSKSSGWDLESSRRGFRLVRTARWRSDDARRRRQGEQAAAALAARTPQHEALPPPDEEVGQMALPTPSVHVVNPERGVRRDHAVIELSDELLDAYHLTSEDRALAGGLLEAGIFEVLRVADALAATMAELRAKRTWLARHRDTHHPCPAPGCRTVGALKAAIRGLERAAAESVEILSCWGQRR